MSDIYVVEPSTSAKVVIHTTKGDLDVELWAKECPKASRNFLQHCIDGYYNKTIFHRVMKNFLIQGGDPTGTGEGRNSMRRYRQPGFQFISGFTGGESVYTETNCYSPDRKWVGFPDEFHPRLKWRYRGMMGVAGRDAPISSITGAPVNDELQNLPHIIGMPVPVAKEQTVRCNGSQFFVSLGRADALNGKYTLFGKVREMWKQSFS